MTTAVLILALALVAALLGATVAALMGHCSTAMIHRAYNHLSSQTELLRAAAAKARPAA